MVEEKISKGQSQRKRRTEKDTCINNLKLNINLSSTKAECIQTNNNKSSRDNLFWRLQKSQERSNRKSDKHARGSLDNVSRISSWDEQCSLRRTRSFAVSRENLFYSLDYFESNNRRAQLIPRAKLVERSFVKDTRYESLRLEPAHLRKFQGKPQEIPPDYSPLPSNPSYKNLPLNGNIYDIPPGYTTRNNSPLVEIIEDFGRYEGKSFEELAGLSLPNYYPDSELTDNVSIADNQSSTRSREKSRHIYLENISWTAEQPESISYDENIVLAKKIEGLYAKPRTIRGPTPYQSFDYEKLFQNSEKSEKVIEKEEAQSSIEFETNTNCDEIKLNNENISKEVVPEQTDKAITIEVPAEDPQEFKSIIEVGQPEAKSHSHNYLKEFLETQKGSKKPLQSFIAKKLSNLTRKKSNLTANQFYSLPDITASKNLHKCEKIDRKLRHCEKLPENRFIVNIGNHFDITAKSNIPVDFQVKIKKKKQAKKTTSDKEDFEEAVKNVNTTLQNNGFCIDFNNNSSQHISLEVKTMDPEIQEKVDNIRNYWTKIAGVDNSIEKCDEMKEAAAENVDSKVSTVKKKFEPEPVEEKAPNKVQLAKQMFEPKLPEKVEKISPTIKETCDFFEKPCYESLCPSAVELVPKSEDKKKNLLSKSNSINVPQFDHVRYKVIKPELFNKKILANCESEEQFDGLMQYLQDYSFHELLIDNNIVIIEPIRSKVPYKQSSSKIVNNPVPKPKINEEGEFDDVKQGIRKHFFFRPIRVNKEVNDDELPRPEVVRQARQFFEKGPENLLPAKEQIYHSSDPDKDKCSNSSTISEHEEEQTDAENLHDSLDCCTEYVSEDILEKIREYGTTVTYYGGRVVNQHHGQPVLTKVIMEEIKDNENRCMECKNCRRRSIDKTLSEVNKEYQGLKFKLVKSNSCSSRLELVGAPNKKEIKKICNNTEKNNNVVKGMNDEVKDKNVINENIKLNNKLDHQPRIIGEERKALNNTKYLKWSQLKRDNNRIQFDGKINNYDYREKLAPSKRNNEMEFEPYEVA